MISRKATDLRKIIRSVVGGQSDRQRLRFSVGAILLGIVASESLLFFDRMWPSIWAHLGTLLLCLALIYAGDDVATVQVLALVPLFRLVNLGMPVFFQLTVYWFPLIYGPLVPAVVFVDRINPDIEVTPGWRRGLLLLPLTLVVGGMLAEVESAILQSEALIPTWSIAQLAMITIVMVCFVGFVEEYLFRGLLQRSLEQEFGRWPGLLLASAVFGMMHSGYGLPEEILFAAVIGLVFGLLYDYFDSLLLVTVTHGVLNVFLFAVIPMRGSFVPL
ncbi:CPBP family intramembrane glutamic endopeptidase [Halosimplex amylolyticum]|uniref:CPBP family intramembrane glutamic endopeptidase n=1 Tax=Halosimplex amylolyticum TaxID=3396616 RepID=UPI003F572D5F